MADQERKPASPFAEALDHSPRENARDADATMGEAERRETEEAQANKERALKDRDGGGFGPVSDQALDRPPD